MLPPLAPAPQRRCDVHWAPLPLPRAVRCCLQRAARATRGDMRSFAASTDAVSAQQCSELDAARNAARFGDRTQPEAAPVAPEDTPAKAAVPWYLEFVAMGTCVAEHALRQHAFAAARACASASCPRRSAGEGLPVAVSRDPDAPRRVVRLRPRTGPHQLVSTLQRRPRALSARI